MENVQPKLRFPEFKDKWKYSHLGEISEKPKYGLNASSKEYDGINGYLRITDIDENSNKFIKKGITSPESFTEDYLLKNGDLLFARTGNSTGKSYLYDLKDGKLFFAGFLIRFRLKSTNNFKFIFYQTKLSSYDKWVKLMSMRSGQPGINSEEYSSLRLTIPSLPEQTKIADFLGAVDKQLELLTTKKEKLQLYKKGVMQKLFSQEIRFTKEDGTNYPDWEEKTLGEVSEKPKYGLNSSAKEYDGTNGYLRITDIDENTNSFISKGITSPESFTDDYLLKKGDLLFARTGNSTGKSYLYDTKDGKLYFAGFLIRFRLKPNNNFKFIFYQTKLSAYDKWVKVMSMRSGQPGINSEEYSNLLIKIPQIEEQTKIADFLIAIDNQLEAIDNQITKTENYKKGLLQQMFV